MERVGDRGEKKGSEEREVGAIVCVLHTGSLTRIYIGIHRRARIGRHYYKTCVCVNPFVLRFRRRRRRHRLSRSRRAASFFALAEERDFAFSSLPSPFSLDPSRSFARSFRIPECKRDARASRPNSNHVTHRIIDRSFQGRRSCFTGLSFYRSPERPPFVCKEAKGEQRDRSTSSYTSFAK